LSDLRHPTDIRCKEWYQSWWTAGWRRSDNFIF
jgi:hypothetical protein